MKNKIIIFYNKISNKYDERYEGFCGKYIAEFEKRKILETLDVRQGDFILDIGTGTGEYAIEMAKKGAVVIGIDISKEIVKKARSKCNSFNVHFIVADAGNLPFKEEVKFDKIVGVGLIEYLNSEDFTELLKHLKSGGVAVFTGVANKYCIYRPILNRLLHNKGGTFKPVDKEYFESQGILVEEVCRYFAIPPFFLRIIRKYFGSTFERFAYYIAYLVEKTPLRFFGMNIFIKLKKVVVK